MNIILVIATLLLLIATVWSSIQKAWPNAFLGAGLTLIALDMSNLLTS